jgi:hypothetical protein
MVSSRTTRSKRRPPFCPLPRPVPACFALSPAPPRPAPSSPSSFARRQRPFAPTRKPQNTPQGPIIPPTPHVHLVPEHAPRARPLPLPLSVLFGRRGAGGAAPRDRTAAPFLRPLLSRASPPLPHPSPFAPAYNKPPVCAPPTSPHLCKCFFSRSLSARARAAVFWRLDRSALDRSIEFGQRGPHGPRITTATHRQSAHAQGPLSIRKAPVHPFPPSQQCPGLDSIARTAPAGGQNKQPTALSSSLRERSPRFSTLSTMARKKVRSCNWRTCGLGWSSVACSASRAQVGIARAARRAGARFRMSMDAFARLHARARTQIVHHLPPASSSSSSSSNQSTST